MRYAPFSVTPESERVLQMAYECGWAAVVVGLTGGGLRGPRFQAFATRDKVPRRLTGVATLEMAVTHARSQIARAAALGEERER